MAERRMFAKTIIDSDKFINMPFSAQALYFHLAMQADDDGFINNHQRIRRTINATEEDMQLLISNQYILPFESGIIVIKHWRIHNYIRSDRYKPTVYEEEKALLTKDKRGTYNLGIPNGNQSADSWDTQVRLGKDSIGKCSIGESNAHAREQNTLYGTFQNVSLSDEELATLKKSYSDWSDRIERLSAYIKSSGKNYDNHYATIIKWAVEDAAKEKEKCNDIKKGFGNYSGDENLTEFEKREIQRRMNKESAGKGDIS